MADWQTIDTAPTDGTTVRVGHNLDASSMKMDTMFKTVGAFRNGTWVCSSAFVCIDHMLRWNPTHWLPEAPNA